ncbi:hypothetical protein NEFER03_1842 [Nematocida sp. LUAm3]|nr:hypothetical protein NEFER03_1842 [Nematocida sp. LUAm3]KAI5174008.1 hypothetical protein NEFER02_0475 [Nematocida sp. LUAm2]
MPITIDEEEFCHQYAEEEKKFLKDPNYGNALKMVQMNSEEYAAFFVLFSRLSSGNALEQLSVIEQILISNPKSHTTWAHRRRLALSSVAKEESSTKDKEFIPKALERDPRDSQCWLYANSVGISSMDFCKQQIDKNPSNYSAYSSLQASGGEYLIGEQEVIDILTKTKENDSLWMFLMSQEEKKRYNESSGYMIRDKNTLIFNLSSSGKTVIKIFYKNINSPIKYEAQCKKTVKILLEEDLPFEKIEKVSVSLSNYSSTTVNLSQTYSPKPPNFLKNALKHTPDNKMLLIFYAKYFATNKKDVIKRICAVDPRKEMLYGLLNQSASIYQFFTALSL